MTYKTLWQSLAPAYEVGEAKAIVDYVLDIRFGMSKADVICGALNEMPADERLALQHIMQRLQQAEPVQYVLGQADFCGRVFAVNPSVLIPRPETEELCHWIAQEHRHRQHLQVLDLCTGSGCIAITLALALPQSRVAGFDISQEALRTAQHNAGRLGAEVDYIVKGIDQESGLVAASRLEAMALKRREYYFRTDRDGNYQIYEGIRAEARVVSVIRAGIFVDLFGAECYIPLRELSYQRWVDATTHYQPGQRVLVKVLGVDRADRNKLHVSASIKQAGENPYEKALKKYSVGNRYVGTVSMVDTTGVFVSLDGIDCLCTYPKRGRPPRGSRVTVRILGINHESNRIWGTITHISTAW